MPFLNRLPAGPGPYSLEGAPDGARPKKWILDPRWFRHLAPKELHRHHATFDHLYRHWLGRELDWEKATGIRYAVQPTDIVAAIIKGTPLRVPIGDPIPTIEMIVEIHPDGKEIAKVLPRWLQRTVTPADVLRVKRRSSGGDGAPATHLTSHPTLILEVAEAKPAERRYQDVRNVFIVPAKFLISPALNLPLTGARPFTVYCHTFGNIDAEAEPNWFYYGVTRRSWQERWAEHARAMGAGSTLKFHSTFREQSRRGLVNFIGHDIVHIASDLDELQDWEEDMVAAAWGDPKLLNMIPGGKAGLAYLAKHGIAGGRANVAPDDRDNVLRDWLSRNPRTGLPAPWIAERWKNPEWAASFVCSGHGRLSIDQVRLIRKLGRSGVGSDEIRRLAGARTIAQIEGVLSGATYARIPDTDPQL